MLAEHVLAMASAMRMPTTSRYASCLICFPIVIGDLAIHSGPIMLAGSVCISDYGHGPNMPALQIRPALTTNRSRQFRWAGRFLPLTNLTREPRQMFPLPCFFILGVIATRSR